MCEHTNKLLCVVTVFNVIFTCAFGAPLQLYYLVANAVVIVLAVCVAYRHERTKYPPAPVDPKAPYIVCADGHVLQLPVFGTCHV